MNAMATLEGVTNQLQGLDLTPDLAPCLPFRPPEDMLPRPSTADDTPRYLFRVFTPRSSGVTDASWTKSKDARSSVVDCHVDIFARDDKRQVANMLHKHLNWRGGPDNLVSWTSSLLFALVYVFYLHANIRDNSSFGEIQICVVDTTPFPKGVFLQDMEPIRAYRAYDPELPGFSRLRESKYYFGEYLSQGALKIEDKCKIVSAQAIIDQGLYDLMPELEEFAGWELQYQPRWAKPVLKLRQGFYKEATERQYMSDKGLPAAMEIAELFGTRWRLPMAINLVALVPHHEEDASIVAAFTSTNYKDNEKDDCLPLRTRVVAPDTLPEVQQCQTIMRTVYKDHCLRKFKESTQKAHDWLNRAFPSMMGYTLEAEDTRPQSHDTLLGLGRNDVLQQLNSISFLCNALRTLLGASAEGGL